MINADILNKLIDEKNSWLWEFINDNYEIEVVEHNDPWYLAYTIKNTAKISITKGRYSPASFTHEMIHVFFSIKNISVGPKLRGGIYGDYILCNLIPEALIEHIANCLEHNKMLPFYLDMGYPLKEFITDYSKKKGSTREATFIKGNFVKDSEYSRLAIEHFIANYFSFKACPNPNFNYEGDIYLLEKTCSSLFSILENYWGLWVKLEEETDDSQFLLKMDLAHKYLIDGLAQWAKDKTII